LDLVLFPGVGSVVAGMELPGGKKMRLLYVLALFQLVAGPLVLMQVAVLCRLTMQEVPSYGVAAGFQKAWHSAEFSAALDHPALVKKSDSKMPLPDLKGKLMKEKMPLLAWQPVFFVKAAAFTRVACADWSRGWPPTWQQAPPGPPPRVG